MEYIEFQRVKYVTSNEWYGGTVCVDSVEADFSGNRQLRAFHPIAAGYRGLYSRHHSHSKSVWYIQPGFWWTYKTCIKLFQQTRIKLAISDSFARPQNYYDRTYSQSLMRMMTASLKAVKNGWCCAWCPKCREDWWSASVNNSMRNEYYQMRRHPQPPLKDNLLNFSATDPQVIPVMMHGATKQRKLISCSWFSSFGNAKVNALLSHVACFKLSDSVLYTSNTTSTRWLCWSDLSVEWIQTRHSLGRL